MTILSLKVWLSLHTCARPVSIKRRKQCSLHSGILGGMGTIHRFHCQPAVLLHTSPDGRVHPTALHGSARPSA